MAIRKKEEILEMVRSRIGDDVSDEAISFVQDISDTINDYEERIGTEDWKSKYEENDAEWRRKYMDAFFTGGTNTETFETEEEEVEEVEEEITTFEELFTEKED